MSGLAKGDRVEDFTADLADGSTVTLSSVLAGGPAVFFFYPKAMTPTCTAQACHFRDLHDEFVAAGASVFGVSRDKAGSQQKFDEKHDFGFPLIADPDGRVAKVFGAKRMGPIPSKRQTYVVGADATVLHVVSSELNAEVHADEALEVLRTTG
jgi:thioredoxin-dependent peroxiredoxin